MQIQLWFYIFFGNFLYSERKDPDPGARIQIQNFLEMLDPDLYVYNESESSTLWREF